MEDGKYGITIIGGLGEVWPTRKGPALYNTDLKDSLKIVVIADVYEKEKIRSRNGIDETFDYIKRERLKEHYIDKNVERNQLLDIF